MEAPWLSQKSLPRFLVSSPKLIFKISVGSEGRIQGEEMRNQENTIKKKPLRLVTLGVPNGILFPI